jgi:hypothetical protein
MAWPTRKDLTKYAYNQFKGHFLGFIVGTSAASFVSTFFETRKISNLWGLTARKTVVSADTFRFLEWFCALVVGFIVFEIVNKLVKDKLSIHLERVSRLESSTPRTSKTIQLIARIAKSFAPSGTNDNQSVAEGRRPNSGTDE